MRKRYITDPGWKLMPWGADGKNGLLEWHLDSGDVCLPHACMHRGVHACVHAGEQACMCVRAWVCVSAGERAGVCVRACMHVCECKHVCVRAHTHVDMLGLVLWGVLTVAVALHAALLPDIQM